MAKADLNINVKVSGSEKAEKQLEGVGKSARKAGDGAKKAGKEFKSFGSGVGDASESLDKRLEQSVGRSFKGVDRLTSIVGQATGAMALMSGGAGLVVAALGAMGVELFKANKAAEEAKRQADELAASYKNLASAIGDAFLASTLKQALEGSSLVADLAKVEAARTQLVETGKKQAADLEFTQRSLARVSQETRLQQQFPEEFGEASRSAGKQIATLTKRSQEQAKAVRETDAQFQQLGVEAQATQGKIDVLRQTIQDTFNLRSDVGPQIEGAGAAAERATSRAARPQRAQRFDEFGPSSEAFFEAQRAREQFAAESRARLIEQERIDQSTRIALIQDADDRQRAIIEARQRDEFSRAALAGADLFQLKRAQSAETEAFEEQVSARRRARQQEEIQRTISTVNQISGALAQGAKAFGLGVGVEMFAAGLQDAGTAASEGSKAAARFAVFDVIGGAAHTLAAGLAGAAAIKNFAGAAQLGKGGGGGGGTPVAAIPAPPPRRSDIGEGGRGEAVTNINVTFTGRSFVTQREIREDVAGLLGSRGRGGRVVA